MLFADAFRRACRPDCFGSGLVIAVLLLVCLDVDADAATSHRITVRTSDGVTLAGTYFEASRHPAPGIVLLHMLTRTHEDWVAAGSRLADAGYAVLAIDFRNGGNAPSASPPFRKSVASTA